MPLRTLLGYDPKASRPRENYGSRFVSYGPVKTLGGRKPEMASSKRSKFPASVNRAQRLPPIDEENALTPRGTPRNASRAVLRNKPEISIRRLPKNTFYQDNEEEEPPVVKSRPIIPVYPMRREVSPPSPQLEKEKVYKEKKPKEDMTPLSPLHVNHTVVDGLVADYLHYARYGHVIPVYEGTSPTTCPCCTNRNRENVRSLLGFPKDLHKAAPLKYDKNSTIKPFEETKSKENDYPNSMYARMKQRQQPEMSAREKELRRTAKQSGNQPWMNYQPHPNATSYLNAEFNRPTVVYNTLYDTEPSKAQDYMASRIVEANSNYEIAMNKLESMSLGGTYYKDY